MEIRLDEIGGTAVVIRTAKDEAKMKQLADSIKEIGVICPIKLRHGDNGKYEVVYGNRRVTASRRAGLKTIPAVIDDIDDMLSHVQAVTENRIREDMSTGDLDIAIWMMRKVQDKSVEEIAKLLAFSQSMITKKLAVANKLLESPELCAYFGVSIEVIEEVEEMTGKDYSEHKIEIEQEQEADEENHNDCDSEEIDPSEKGFILSDSHHEVMPRSKLTTEQEVKALAKAKEYEMPISLFKQMCDAIGKCIDYGDQTRASALLRIDQQYNPEKTAEFYESFFNLPKEPETPSAFEWAVYPSVKQVLDTLKDWRMHDIKNMTRTVELGKASPEAESFLINEIERLIGSLNKWKSTLRSL